MRAVSILECSTATHDPEFDYRKLQHLPGIGASKIHKIAWRCACSSSGLRESNIGISLLLYCRVPGPAKEQATIQSSLSLVGEVSSGKYSYFREFEKGAFDWMSRHRVHSVVVWKRKSVAANSRNRLQTKVIFKGKTLHSNRWLWR